MGAVHVWVSLLCLQATNLKDNCRERGISLVKQKDGCVHTGLIVLSQYRWKEQSQRSVADTAWVFT